MSGSDQAAENPWPRVKSRASSGHRGSSQIFGTITLCLVNAAAPHEALSGPIRQGVMAGTYRMVCFFTLSCLIFRSSVDRGIPSLAVDRENIESVEEFLDAASRLRVSRVLVGRQSQPGHIGRLRGGTIARGRSSWWRRIASSVEKGASIATSDSPATSPSCPSFHFIPVIIVGLRLKIVGRIQLPSGQLNTLGVPGNWRRAAWLALSR
jgi:hypothetical protein